MTIRNHVALGGVALFAALTLAACSGQTPLSPSSTAFAPGAGGTFASTSSRSSSALASHGGPVTDRPRGGGNDATDDHGHDVAPHDAADDRGRDGAAHDAADDHGLDRAHDNNNDPGRGAGDDNARHDAGELTGVITGLTGQCTDLSFTIGTTTVTTSVGTLFTDVACGTLTNGMTVEVKGVVAGTTLAATELERLR